MTLELFRLWLPQAIYDSDKNERKNSRVIRGQIHEFSTLQVFNVDHVAKIRSGLSLTVLEKKMNKITPKKCPTFKTLKEKSTNLPLKK